MADTVECKATSGTWARSTAAAYSYFNASKTWQYVGGSTYQSFLYTVLPSDLAGANVVSAVLQVNMVAGSGSRDLKVQRHAKPATSYASMTWNNRPGVLSGSSTVTVTQDSADTLWEFDVTDDLAAVAAGDAFYGWRISSTYSSQWGIYGWGSTKAARLLVTISVEPTIPAGLAPSGVTALDTPTFTWLRPDGLISAQIQVDAVDGDFASPSWDSGTVATTAAQIDTGAEGWSGLADDESVDVRLRQTTDTGTSGWTDPVTVTRRALGTVAITSPSGTTADPTPTIVHTYSDTQTRWQKLIRLGAVLLADSGVTPGTDTAWTPPSGATTAGASLTLVTRVWDDEARTPSAGDPGYAEDTATVTYTPTASVGGVDSLAVVQDGANPWTDWVWTRAAGVADEYVLVRGGVIIDRIDGTSGGDPVWTYRDWTCPPNTDVLCQVLPVVEGETSSLGPTTSARVTVSGLWLVDSVNGLSFSVSGNQLELGFAESSVSYQPPGASHPTKRTFALRGLEGSVGGQLNDRAGRTIEEQKADFYAMKALPSATFRLVFGDVNVPVVTSDLTMLVDATYARTTWMPQQVSFTVAQNGELPFPEVSPS